MAKRINVARGGATFGRSGGMAGGRAQQNPLHEIAFLMRMQDPGHPNVVGLAEALDDGGLSIAGLMGFFLSLSFCLSS